MPADPPETFGRVAAKLRAAGCVWAEDEAAALVETAAGDAERLAAMVARRVAGEPLEHVVGWVEIAGVRAVVSPGVFVPRQRTAALVRVARGEVRPGSVVLDLCCGCGALGLALSDAAAEVWAADLDPAAAADARRNLGPARVVVGDLYDPLPGHLRGRVDVLACNAPYVPTAALAGLPREARDHERRLALDGGTDGLDVHRRVIAGAPGWLAPAGLLLIEVGEDQVDTAAALMAAAGLAPGVHRDDDLGATVVTGRGEVATGVGLGSRHPG